jgi:hypothetical protein
MAPVIAKLMAKELNKNKKWIRDQVINFIEVARKYIVS